jgi:cation diffusion facilitator CzcD-associated flavoprotein CzcO
MRRVLRNIPGIARAYRWLLATVIDILFLHFDVEQGTAIRRIMEGVPQTLSNRTLSDLKNAIAYMKRTTPEKYHDTILPKYRLGQKRRVFDTEYLQCLHRENVLLTNDLVTRVTPTSVVTTSGKEYEADVIILANGFHMQSFIFPMKIVNKTRGLTLDDAPETGVWRETGPQAYLGTPEHLSIPAFFYETFHPRTLLTLGRMLCPWIPEFVYARWSKYRDGPSQRHVHIRMRK